MKLKISPSALANYNECPFRFHLSRELNAQKELEIAEFSTKELSKRRMEDMSEAMRQGLLFEGYLFNRFKGGDDERKLLEGSKKDNSLSFIRKQAEFVEKVFVQGDDFLRVEYEAPHYLLRGEIDFFGEIDVDYLSDICGEKLSPFLKHSIIDVKRTGNIQRIWDVKTQREDFLQSLCYPYMMWKKHGEKYPFFYLIVDAEFEKPLVKIIEIDYSDFDFQFLEKLMNRVASDFWYNPVLSPDTCGGEKMLQTRCKYVQHCEHGRLYLGGHKLVKFNV
jgi:hypothetical protein